MLYSYDVRVEEVVMRALTLLDSSRHKEMLCQQRLEQLKLAVLEEEERATQRQEHALEAPSHVTGSSSLIDEALQPAVLRGVPSANLDADVERAAEDDDLGVTVEAGREELSSGPSGLLHGAYQKLMAVAINATSSSPNPDPASAPASRQAADPTFDLSMALAQAYADLGDAQEEKYVWLPVSWRMLASRSRRPSNTLLRAEESWAFGGWYSSCKEVGCAGRGGILCGRKGVAVAVAPREQNVAAGKRTANCDCWHRC